MNDPRMRVLLLLALALAAVRFALLPWFEWQGEKREALQVLTQRLDRSEGLVRARVSIERNATLLASEAQKARSIYPTVNSPDEFRLVAQQQLAALAQQCGVVIKVFDFLTEGEVQGANLHFIRGRLQLEGQARQIARFQGELEGRLQNAAVRSLRFDSNVLPLVFPGEALVQAAVMIDLYFGLPPQSGKAP